MSHSISVADILNGVKLHPITVTDRGPGKPRQPVLVRSCSLYAYKDNRKDPDDPPPVVRWILKRELAARHSYPTPNPIL